MNDREVVAVQIGRPPRSPVDVVTRCHLGLPIVTRVPPHLDDGTPFPTLYWLSCPLAALRIDRLESGGGVKAAEERIAADPALAAALAAANERYERERNALIAPDAPQHRPSGGVAGTRNGVKCLHAHYADHAAGNANPVGADTARSIEPLDCSAPCVIAGTGGDGAIRNPDWVELLP
jgi:hypothetical protein